VRHMYSFVVWLCWCGLAIVGCSGMGTVAVPDDPAVPGNTMDWTAADTIQRSADVPPPFSASVQLVANRSSSSPKPSTKPAPSREPVPSPEEEAFYDPFAREGEQEAGQEYDPWEPLNTKIFEFNRQVDRWVLKPVAQGYNFIVPSRLQVGIHNFFYNVRFPPRFFNNVFQGKFKGAGIEVSRFLINTTAGLAGFIDVAERMDLTTPEEDAGQTFGVYGVPPGPYLIVPFLPPFTVRDFFGYLTDIALNPINWLVFPIIEVEGIPSVVSHPNRNFSTFAQLGTRIGDIINERALSLEKFQGVEEATLDLYTAVRNAYLQARRKQLRE
jgi:phospholipid-binding lipoprotein MlaA